MVLILQGYSHLRRQLQDFNAHLLAGHPFVQNLQKLFIFTLLYMCVFYHTPFEYEKACTHLMFGQLNVLTHTVTS